MRIIYIVALLLFAFVSGFAISPIKKVQQEPPAAVLGATTSSEVANLKELENKKNTLVKGVIDINSQLLLLATEPASLNKTKKLTQIKDVNSQYKTVEKDSELQEAQLLDKIIAK